MSADADRIVFPPCPQCGAKLESMDVGSVRLHLRQCRQGRNDRIAQLTAELAEANKRCAALARCYDDAHAERAAHERTKAELTDYKDGAEGIVRARIQERDAAQAEAWNAYTTTTALLDSLGEYVRQSMSANPEWAKGIRAAEEARIQAGRAAGTAGRDLAARVTLLEELAAADLALRHFDCPHYEPPCKCGEVETALLARYEAALDALDPEKQAALDEKGGG